MAKWSKIAAQIKILVDITEHIWTAVDCKDFTKATLLFVLAKYIKTSKNLHCLCLIIIYLKNLLFYTHGEIN